MEENRRFSLSDLLIKAILVIIFVLFAVWLLSISNKKMTNSLSVLTDKIFAENIDRMKEVGKEYFTTERLPQKVGEIETLTLQEMYDKNLILPVKDKNGKLCDAEDSYITIEKLENEYQMKVNLECEDEEDFIIVIMGCYDYCDNTDICEKEEVKVEKEEYVKGETQIEYEYKKIINGKWTDYGAWSEWSKIEIAGNDYRQVETKIVEEEFTYDKVEKDIEYKEVIASCPEGYKKTSDGTKCYKTTTTSSTEKPVCPTVSGFTLSSQDGFTCKYTKSTTSSEKPVCPTVSGFTLSGQDGFTCKYTKTTTSTVDPVCPAKSGWNVSRSGFTCNYSRSVTTSYQVPVTVSKTCYSQKVVKPCGSCAPVTQNIPYDCSTTSYETRYDTKTETDSSVASCPSGYNKSGDNCVSSSTVSDTKTASCPSGYNKSGNSCVKSTSTNSYKELILSCPSGFNMDNGKTSCSRVVEKTVKVSDIKEVTYYRYRIRQYIGGSVDYKWSTSKNDKTLINAGYFLTGKTR